MLTLGNCLMARTVCGSYRMGSGRVEEPRGGGMNAVADSWALVTTGCTNCGNGPGGRCKSLFDFAHGVLTVVSHGS